MPKRKDVLTPGNKLPAALCLRNATISGQEEF